MSSGTIARGFSPSFFIGDIPIYGDLILAPMDGYSDLPFRSLARRLGSAISYTEFLNAIDVLYGHPHLEQKLAFLEDERPVVFQIFDDDPDRLVKAALKLRSRNPDIIDVNMGCSAKCVSGRGAGAGLLRTPQKIASIFSRLTSELDIPVTGKIRLGWDAGSLNYLEVAQIIEENGGQMIAVHGRTKAQAYSGEADWEAIARVKQKVHIPVIANGDVRTVADISRIKETTGCDGVMIARAAISNPWIFTRIDRTDVPAELLKTTLIQHLESMLTFYGPERGQVLFRKYAARYLLPYNIFGDLRRNLMTSARKEEFLALLDQVIQGPITKF
jgi:tRNA-dihydrouridine synthase B